MTNAADLSLASYLTRLRKRAGMSLEKVAKAAGFSGRSSVQRYFEDHTIETLKPDVASKFAKALYHKGNPPILLDELERLITKNTSSIPTEISVLARLLDMSDIVFGDRTDWDGPHEMPFVMKEHLPVAGVAHASAWVEHDRNDNKNEMLLAFPFDSRNFSEDDYALRIVGNSVNRYATEGTYAICRKFGDKKTGLSSGRFVHVERTKEDFVEWTIKRIKYDANGMLLCPESTDPEHQEPLEFGDDDRTIRIIGVVVAFYRDA